ncbi:NAD(P)H-dependent oxidoreductase [Pseudomonas sp. G34]|uniref:FMN-dependent NADH-azoreductase n=1 Tax=Pseudomonas sp. G34 TaxID=3059083 RepID=UPI00280A14EE|nr:NAD(P)H-dependent oxidoreductase [Pseudomonas sp. G34]MDQ7987655.1 NAD(P)H-dependent oxidoreductase [Pseudomonas sp. G34]
MKRILLLECSPHQQRASGSQLARRLIAARWPRAELLERDLVGEPLPPLGADYAAALTSSTALDDSAFACSEALIAELEASDCLIIVTPMHNFAVPAALKLWIDYVLRLHRSFAATPAGKVGLLQDRPTLVLVSAGGFYQGPRARQADFLTAYLRHVLSTLGITEVAFVHLQGLAHGEASVQAALDDALPQLQRTTSFYFDCATEIAP